MQRTKKKSARLFAKKQKCSTKMFYPIRQGILKEQQTVGKKRLFVFGETKLIIASV